MNKAMKKIKKTLSTYGFTLIELIVVITVLGILALIAIPILGSFNASAEERAHQSNVRIIKGAAQIYILEQADLPDEVDLAEEEVVAGSALSDYLNLPLTVPGGGGNYSVAINDGIITVKPDAPGSGGTGPVIPGGPYTVTFVDWDNTELSTQSVVHGGAASAPSNPSREGHTFTGWSAGFSNVTSNLTVTAQYGVVNYSVTFEDWDGTVLKVETVVHGSSATAPSTPSREGHTFSGWSLGFNNVTSNLIVSAQYNAITATGASAGPRISSSIGNGANKEWTISVNVTISLSDGSSYFHGLVTADPKPKGNNAPALGTLSETVTGTTSSGIPYNYTVSF